MLIGEIFGMAEGMQGHADARHMLLGMHGEEFCAWFCFLLLVPLCSFIF